MAQKLRIYNTLKREKEDFEPINPPMVGMYVCGPTVYNDVHIGNCRTLISFDMIYRHLTYLGYNVRYVRNITDVGHLENDADEGEDKIGKKAKLENLEPMEIVQKYTLGFHKVMEKFNALPPSIEPTATGHIVEQIDFVQKVIDNGYGYESKGSVYFDVVKFAENHDYGALSGRKIEELQNNTRTLAGQDEKKNPLDFVIWKKASPNHIMQWNSPWGKGFPGWHLECSAMSKKYLGEEFDIHGGGMDLKFPHHECEVAQNIAGGSSKTPIKYWMHTNMLTLDGEKMSKSTGKFFLPEDIFEGTTDIFEKAVNPMVVRFFMMQTHYRSTLDISNDALMAADKAFARVSEAYLSIDALPLNNSSDINAEELFYKAIDALNDDFNTPIALTYIFEAVKYINAVKVGQKQIDAQQKEHIKKLFDVVLIQIMGVKIEAKAEKGNSDKADELMSLLVEMRANAKSEKNFATADFIRDELAKLNITLKDSKDGTSWTMD
jgi:cysteinyl-tRNA synthetase